MTCIKAFDFFFQFLEPFGTHSLWDVSLNINENWTWAQYMEKYTEGSIVISSTWLGNALHICYHIKNMQTPEGNIFV